MPKSSSLLALALLAANLLSSCANPHFFPRTRPLFAGLDEANVPPTAKNSLAKAKVDFQLAKHGKAPHYAKLAHTIPHTRSQVFEGSGYRLTMVHKDTQYPHRQGPEIV